MRIAVHGWLHWHDLSYAEAEAYHLRQAAKIALSGDFDAAGQDYHLAEAERNRYWNRHRRYRWF